MRLVIIVGLLGLAALSALAQAPPAQTPNYPEVPARNLDPTLNYYLSVSEYALAGQVVSEPVKQDKLFSYQQGKDPRAIYSCRVKVLESLHNQIVPKDQELTVVVVRWPDLEDKLPAGVKKGEKYIFFLHWNYGTLGPHTVDPWFGVQRYNLKMVELLRKMGNRPMAR
jgi:hypothetical protein